MTTHRMAWVVAAWFVLALATLVALVAFGQVGGGQHEPTPTTHTVQIGNACTVTRGGPQVCR